MLKPNIIFGQIKIWLVLPPVFRGRTELSEDARICILYHLARANQLSGALQKTLPFHHLTSRVQFFEGIQNTLLQS